MTPPASIATNPSIAIVIVTYNSGDSIAEVVTAAAAQIDPGDQIVIVDNGSADETIAAVGELDLGVKIVETGENLGFAGGCHRGVDASSSDLLFFLNPDAVPAPGSIAALKACAGSHSDWGAWQALVTLPGGQVVNTCGGVVQFLGFAWAGGNGEPVDEASVAGEVGFASGAAMVVRRQAWTECGGFDAAFFMYHEDVDLSLNLRLHGYGVGVEPSARVEHDYEFEKGGYKWELLETNRWRTVLGCYPWPLLILLIGPLLLLEPAMLVVALRGGWARQKLRAQRHVLGQLFKILRRRRSIQAGRSVSTAEFARHFAVGLDSNSLPAATRSAVVALPLSGIWAIVRLVLRVPR